MFYRSMKLGCAFVLILRLVPRDILDVQTQNLQKNVLVEISVRRFSDN